MNANTDSATQLFEQIRPTLPGLLCAALTLLFGFGLGIVFGANEDAIKSRLKASATEVSATVYQNNEVAMKAALDKSWTYVQRAHLHAGGMGAAAVALIVVTGLLGGPAWLLRATGVGLGAGGLGYSIYWLMAAFRLPSLGSSDAAKESLEWLAMPSSGAFVAATITVAGLLVVAIARKRPAVPEVVMSRPEQAVLSK